MRQGIGLVPLFTCLSVLIMLSLLLIRERAREILSFAAADGDGSDADLAKQR